MHLINKGLWSSDTLLSFEADGADGGKIVGDGKDLKSFKIEVCNINSFLQEDVDFLKLDIEGAEFEVLNACKKNLRRVKFVFIEYHSFFNENQNLNEILNILRDNEFRIHITSPGLSSISPLNEIIVDNKMDFQLNIFAYKNNESITFKHI